MAITKKRKITQLPPAGSVSGSEWVEIVQDGQNKRVLISQIPGGGGGGSDRRTVTAVTSSAGIVTLDYALGDYFTLELSENVIGWSILNPPAAGVGGTIAIRITQDHVSRTVVWDPNYHQFTASSPLDKVRSDPGSDTLLIMTTFDGSIWMATMDTHR